MNTDEYRYEAPGNPQSGWEELLARTMREPGIAEIVEAYEGAERAYISVTMPSMVWEFTASSTVEEPLSTS